MNDVLQRRMETTPAISLASTSMTETVASSTQVNTAPNIPGNNALQRPVPGWDSLLHLTNDNYKSIFHQDRDIFVMFYAKWCHTCSPVKSIFVELARTLVKSTAQFLAEEASSLNSVATLAVCDVDAVPALAEEFHLRDLPTFKYVRNGEAISEYDGPNTMEGFMEYLQRMSDVK